MQGLGFRVRLQVQGCRVHGVGCRVQGAGCRVQGAGRRVQGAGCRVQGAGCRVQGVGRGARRAVGGGARRGAFRGALSPRRLLVGFKVQRKGKGKFHLHVVVTPGNFQRHVVSNEVRGEDMECHGGRAGKERREEEKEEAHGDTLFEVHSLDRHWGGGGGLISQNVSMKHLPHKIVDALFTATNQNDCVGQLTL